MKEQPALTGRGGGCVICNSLDGAHEHHVVPQSYGGTYGPKVVLCGTHHTVIHDIALKPLDQQYGLILGTASVPKDKAQFVFDMTQTIAKSKQTFRMQRIPAIISVTLSRQHSAKLRELQKVLGASNQAAAVEACIDNTYKAAFPLKSLTP